MSTRKKKNRNLGPRRKRMRRPARLQAAVKWRAGYGGKNIVRGYARWFGVDLLCAMTELRILGVAVEAEYEQQIRRTVTARAEGRARWRAANLTERTKPPTSERSADWPVEWIPSSRVKQTTRGERTAFPIAATPRTDRSSRDVGDADGELKTPVITSA